MCRPPILYPRTPEWEDSYTQYDIMRTPKERLEQECTFPHSPDPEHVTYFLASLLLPQVGEIAAQEIDANHKRLDSVDVTTWQEGGCETLGNPSKELISFEVVQEASDIVMASSKRTPV
ncbi:hypothetical protein NDU88_007777 [Pleurodeles waltl]|uniref:Uncharacterized protein n=1 Tax=Pleurodeles waltl TaxID=8319 RepID=A0AAV7QQR3_PLEWA|nr:hypothetical protein NDU88_007777 [Pleurodeles waltl]